VDTHYQELKSEDKSGVDNVKVFCLTDTRYQASDPKSRPFHEVSEGAFGKNDLFSQFSFQPSFSKPEACQPAAFCLADTRYQASRLDEFSHTKPGNFDDFSNLRLGSFD